MEMVGWLFICLLFLWWFVFPFFPPRNPSLSVPQSAESYLTGTALHASHQLLFQTRLRLFVNVSVATLDTVIKGVPERFCPTFGASAVLRGRHLLSKCLREHRPSHFCPVQQGKYENNPLVINKQKSERKCSTSRSLLKWHWPTRALSESSGELCACSSVQGSKQGGKEQARPDPLSGRCCLSLTH